MNEVVLSEVPDVSKSQAISVHAISSADIARLTLIRVNDYFGVALPCCRAISYAMSSFG
jgi:hypothetical protein